MPTEARLRRLQEGFLADLFGRHPRDPGARAETLREPPAGGIEDRWAVYARGLPVRIEEALQEDFPALGRILGGGPYRSLVARYVRACPPRSFDLGRAGDRLSRFLQNDPLTAELPFLPDLARMEWRLSRAFVAADVEPLAWVDLAGEDPEAVAETPLAVRPGTALVRSQWPIHDLWSCREMPDDAVSVPLEGRPQRVLIWREGLEVRCRTVEETEARLVEGAAAGSSLAALHEEGEAEGALIEAFRGLVKAGIFRRTARRRVRRRT
jgi:uncharacterized protein